MDTPPGRLSGKTAIITGASRGIGRAIARRFAEAGAAVGLIARSDQPLAELTRDLVSAGATAHYVVTDIGVPAAVAAAVAALRTKLGPASILVNNAGTVLRKRMEETSDDEWRAVMAVNLDGAFFMTRALLPDLVANEGRIINVASIAGREGTPMLSAYCASKHGLVGFTRALAEELRDRHVVVNAICPGSVDTAMLRKGLPEASPDMTPEDIAATAFFLAADAPRALTGSCLDVFG